MKHLRSRASPTSRQTVTPCARTGRHHAPQRTHLITFNCPRVYLRLYPAHWLSKRHRGRATICKTCKPVDSEIVQTQAVTLRDSNEKRHEILSVRGICVMEQARVVVNASAVHGKRSDLSRCEPKAVQQAQSAAWSTHLRICAHRSPLSDHTSPHQGCIRFYLAPDL